MSIITDALKKIQADRSNQKSPDGGTDQREPETPGDREQQLLKKSPLGRGLINQTPAIVILVIMVCLISLGIFFSFLTQRTSKEKIVPDKERSAEPGLKAGMPKEKSKTLPAASTGSRQEKNSYSIEHLSKTEAAKPIIFGESQTTANVYPVLNGIMYSPSRPQAIINGQVVTEGETVQGFTVDKILASIVRGRLGNEEIELKLK